MTSFKERMNSAAFKLDFNLGVVLDGRTHDILVTYTGDFRAIGYASADVVVTGPDGAVESRVIDTHGITHVLDRSSGGWEIHYDESPYSIDLRSLFGLGAPVELKLTGRKTRRDGVEMHVISGRLLDVAVAGARGDFDVVYWVSVDDGLLREVFGFSRLELDSDTTMVGGEVAEATGVKVTAKLFDHGKRVDLTVPATLYPRFGHEAILLDDGRVLVVGGFTGIANNDFIAPFPLGIVQIYEPETGTWRVVEPLEGPGLAYSAIKLSDGRVLFVGLGEGDEDKWPELPGVASLFDPGSDLWTPLRTPVTPGLPSLVQLGDGRVLAAGGLVLRRFPRPTCAGSESWTRGRDLRPRDGELASGGGDEPSPG